MFNFDEPAHSQHQSADELFQWLEDALPAADRQMNATWGRGPAPPAQEGAPAADALSSEEGDRSASADQGDDADANGARDEGDERAGTEKHKNGTEDGANDDERAGPPQQGEHEREEGAPGANSPPTIRTSARIRERTDIDANIGDANHVTASTSEERQEYATRRINSLESPAYKIRDGGRRTPVS